MQFRVTKSLKNKDRSHLPQNLSVIPSLKQNDISGIRYLKLVGSADEFDRPLLLLNNKHWHDPITENPQLGTTEIWAFTNTTNFSHPIHIHLVQFQVLEHQPFDLEQYNQDGKIIFTGPPEAPQQITAAGKIPLRFLLQPLPESSLNSLHIAESLCGTVIF